MELSVFVDVTKITNNASYGSGKIPTRVKIDLFYLYNNYDDNKAYAGGMMPSTRQQMRWIYPVITNICSVDLLDHLMFIPCNFEKIIEVWSWIKLGKIV